MYVYLVTFLQRDVFSLVATVKLLKIWTPEKSTVIIQKFDLIINMHLPWSNASKRCKDADRMASSVDPV